MLAKATKPAENVAGDILEKANIVHALSYVPYLIGAIAMYFLGKTEKKAAMHHIKYSVMLAVGVIALTFILNGFFAKILALVYLIGSGVLAFKAYKGEEVKVEILDTIEKKVTETVSK